MNAEVTIKLMKHLEEIKKGDVGPNSALTRFVMAWLGLIGGIVFLARFITFEPAGSQEWLEISEGIILISIILRSFYVIVWYNFNKRMRPVLEALLHEEKSS